MYDYSILPNRIVLCVDLRSFYASVSYIKMGLDLAVVRDVNRIDSIVLAATRVNTPFISGKIHFHVKLLSESLTLNFMWNSNKKERIYRVE